MTELAYLISDLFSPDTIFSEGSEYNGYQCLKASWFGFTWNAPTTKIHCSIFIPTQALIRFEEASIIEKQRSNAILRAYIEQTMIFYQDKFHKNQLITKQLEIYLEEDFA